jgi:aminopeptidase YwaD
MTIKKLSGLSLLLLVFFSSTAQDRDYARSLIDSLASPYMYGRAYINNGDSLAAAFIASQFEAFGLSHFNDDYYQPFTLNANTFPAKVNVKLNGVSLKPGEEFAVNAASHGDQGEYRIRVVKERMLTNYRRLQRFDRRDHSGNYIYFDINRREIQDRQTLRVLDSLVRNNTAGARGAIFRQPAIWWHAWSRGMSEEAYTSVNIRSDLIPRRPKTIETDIENQCLEDYVTRNVIAWIPGKSQPDTFLVITAHYDHIGMMGQEAVFPGANDNASGTAMLLDLARHYSISENRHDYSLAFMTFSGEESGLLGSKYYTENPYFPLEQIGFLINLDMVGTGSDGLLVFNGTTDSLRFETMNRINQKNDYLTELKMRGISRSSDHYYFHQKGVPAFFLLTTGSEHRHYHNIYDTREALPLTKYDEVFRLITSFFDTF